MSTDSSIMIPLETIGDEKVRHQQKQSWLHCCRNLSVPSHPAPSMLHPATAASKPYVESAKSGRFLRCHGDVFPLLSPSGSLGHTRQVLTHSNELTPRTEYSVLSLGIRLSRDYRYILRHDDDCDYSTILYRPSTYGLSNSGVLSRAGMNKWGRAGAEIIR